MRPVLRFYPLCPSTADQFAYLALATTSGSGAQNTKRSGIVEGREVFICFPADLGNTFTDIGTPLYFYIPTSRFQHHQEMQCFGICAVHCKSRTRWKDVHVPIIYHYLEHTISYNNQACTALLSGPRLCTILSSISVLRRPLSLHQAHHLQDWNSAL